MILPDNINTWPVSSVTYSIPYIVMALMVCVVCRRNVFNGHTEISRRQALFLIVVFLLFFGLRWHIMTDTLVYEEEYYTFVPNFSWNYIEVHSWWWDKGFVIFAMICKLITPSFFFFVFVNSLIDILLFSLCVKKYEVNAPIAILAFMAFQGLLMEINTMRNIKAILLFVYSISYIEEKRLWKYVVINALGFTFHSSALLFFPMYWLLNRKYSKKYLYPILAFFTIIYLANINLIQDYMMSITFSDDPAARKLSNYLETSEESSLSLGFIERVVTLLLCLYIYPNIKKNDKGILIFINSYYMFYILYAIFGFNFVFRDRIPYLFIASYWFLYPYLFKQLSKRKVYSYLFLIVFGGKIFLSTHICSAYYETSLFHETTRAQRGILNEKSE